MKRLTTMTWRNHRKPRNTTWRNQTELSCRKEIRLEAKQGIGGSTDAEPGDLLVFQLIILLVIQLRILLVIQRNVLGPVRLLNLPLLLQL